MTEELNEAARSDRTSENVEERIKRVFALTENERAELPYRRASALSFIVVMLLFGVPLWWHTTSTYRVSFRSFPSDQRIVIPVHIRVASWNRSSDSRLERVSLRLISTLQNLTNIELLDLLYDLHFQKMERSGSLSASTVRDGCVNAHLAIIDSAEWLYSGETLHFGSQSWAYVKDAVDDDTLLQRMLTAVTDVLVDVGHLSAIIRRDLKNRIDPLEMAALPSNQQKRLVWDSAALSAQYIVQVIFVHTGSEVTPRDYSPDEVLFNIQRFADNILDVTKLKVSSEHLWDFDLVSWIRPDVQGRLIIDMDIVTEIVTAVDQETSTVESSAPVLKLVVLDYLEHVVLLDQMGEDSSGIVVASWGAVVSHQGGKFSTVSQSLIGALRVLLALDTDLPYASGRDPSPVSEWELNRMKLRSFVDCSMNAISSVQAIHRLISQIDNIVINDEVASTADKAVELISRALDTAKTIGRLEVSWAVEGRDLAVQAVNDHSLLALLYFPNDQKFAVYLPLFLPTLLPLFGSMLALYRYWTGKE